ncbi:hypothetical protein [Solidesulfovibrio sp.]|jgi:hypothetical protein|uniref:hypothetical protein n=1 Tax=Solidesulfovibrio sp. TaxID=2910990 RepID=UPI002B1F1E97|nr:hypothetical protein [Solidesulfovibrio sp.]MEA5090316.1 hypothetical protein [Solidesulfovibrio sp.]
MTRLGVFSFLLACALLFAASFPTAAPAAGLELSRYKDLRNAYMKVTDIQERERSEEKYVPSGGKVTLQKVPYKEVVVTGELRQKPPASMDAMFGGGEGQPLLKVCMARYDASGALLEEECQGLRFESMVKGNVGTALFRIPEGTARYEFRLPEAKGDKGSAIKLWYPTN